MTIIRTATSLNRRDIRRLERHGYEILVTETRELETGTDESFIWGRDDDLGIPECALPY